MTRTQHQTIAGQYPAGVCFITAKFIANTETGMDSASKAVLHSTLPSLENSRDPNESDARLMWLAERALRKWTPEALEANGHTVMAKAIRDEPSSNRAETLARQAAATITAHVTAKEWAAGRTAHESARAMGATQREDPLDRPAAAVFAAQALRQWAEATGQDRVKEASDTVHEMLDTPKYAPGRTA